MPQKKQTDDEIYKTLLENLDAVKDLPEGRGSNIELDEDDERVLQEIYGVAEEEETSSSGAASDPSS